MGEDETARGAAAAAAAAGAGAGAGAAGGRLPPLPRGVTRLYLLEAKGGIHELAGHMQALTRTLEALKSDAPRAWRAEIMYKTLKSAAAAKTSPLESDGPGRGGGAGGGNESLYVVKSSEFPGRTFMMAAKPIVKAGGARKASGGVGAGGSTGAKPSGKQLSPIVETGPLGDEVVGVLKGYANRLVLTLEGSAYRVSGGLLEACAGFLRRGNALAAIALQVRYDHAHCSLPEAHRVIEEFVALCIPGVGNAQDQAAAPAGTASATAGGAGAGAGRGGGGAQAGSGSGSGLRVRPIDPPAVAALLGAGAAGGGGKASAAQAAQVPLGGLEPGALSGPKLRVLQYAELFGTT